MSKVHSKTVIQFLMAKGCTEYQVLKEFMDDIKPDKSKELTEDHIYRIIEQCNQRLGRFNMMIRQTMDEITTKKYHILISTVNNDITRAASHYDIKQFEFYKLLLQAIVHDPCGLMEEKNVVNYANQAKVSTTKTRGSKPEYVALVDEWCEKKWLYRLDDDDVCYITLGVRALAELDVFIKQKLIEKPEDLDCRNCQSMSIYSQSCPNCQARFHKRCYKMSKNPETGSCKYCPGVSTDSLDVASRSVAPTRRRARV